MSSSCQESQKPAEPDQRGGTDHDGQHHHPEREFAPGDDRRARHDYFRLDRELAERRGNFLPLSAATNSRATFLGMPSVDFPAAAACMGRRWASGFGGVIFSSPP